MSSYLETVLINSYNPNHDLRVQAEAQLQQFCQTKGSCTQLLQLVGNKSIDRNVRQAAEIVFKNRLRTYWSDAENEFVANEEKDFVKNHIIEILIFEEDKSIKGLLADNIRTISEFDYPEKWSDLIQKLLSYIQSSDPTKMFNALLAMRKVIKRYEYKPRNDRPILNNIILSTFPTLQQIITVLLENNSIEAAHIMRICLKIFWSTTVYALSDVNGVDVNLWFNSLAYILQKPLPEAHEGLEPAGQPLHPVDRQQWPWWKLKKWAARIVAHFIQRYGNPRYAGEEYKAFADFFRANTSVTLLAPVMNSLALKPTGKYVTNEVFIMSMNYLTSCVEMSPPYKAIKPHLDFLIFQVIFPTLAMSEEELSLFKNDPQEFIRKVHDPFEDTLDPRVAATTLLQMLARYRQKDVLPMVMPFIHNCLMEYAHAPVQNKNYRQKDAILVAVASLIKVLRDSKEYSKYVSTFFVTHVLPEFSSPVDFIRARAFWVVEYFDEEDYASNGVLKNVIDGLLKGLTDPSLPVQSASACSIRGLIEAEGTKELLRPVLPQLVSQYFRIMKDVENDAVLSSLQAIVDVYGAEINPMAVTMVEHLMHSFSYFSKMDSDDESAAFSATQSLDTILAVLDAVQEIPETIRELEFKLVPLLSLLLVETPTSFEYLEHCLSIMSYLTFYTSEISESMWQLCGPLLLAFSSWAYDFIRDISVPVTNFMSKNITIFLQGQYNGMTLADSLLTTIKKTFEEDINKSEYDAKASAALLNTFLVCVRCSGPVGSIDSILINIVTLIFKRIAITKTKDLRIRLFECILACIYYNPISTLQCIESIGGTLLIETFFNSLFDQITSMTRDSTQRMVVLSFLTLFSLPANHLPPIIARNIPNMFQQIIREIVSIEQEAAKEEEEADGENNDEEEEEYEIDDEEEDDEEEEEEEEDEEDNKKQKNKDKNNTIVTTATRLKKLEVPDGGYHEDEDCLNAEDEAYRQALERMQKDEADVITKRQLYREGQLVGDGTKPKTNDDDSTSSSQYTEDDDDDDEEYSATLPTEVFDMSIYFVDAMTALSQQNASMVQTLQGGLAPEDASRLQEIIRTAEERKNEKLVSNSLRSNPTVETQSQRQFFH